MEDLKRIERSALQRARRAKKAQDVANIRAEVLGKKGKLGVVLRGLGELPAVERRGLGLDLVVMLERGLLEGHHRDLPSRVSGRLWGRTPTA